MAQKKSRSSAHKAKSSGSRSLWIGAGAGALAAIVLAGVVLAFVGGDDGPDRPSGHEPPVVITGPTTDVEIVDSAFKPKDIVVSKGTEVTWINTGDLPHDVTEQVSNDRQTFASETLRKGDTFEHKFDTPGDYYYYCTIHHTMLGSVVVRQ